MIDCVVIGTSLLGDIAVVRTNLCVDNVVVMVVSSALSGLVSWLLKKK